jgi:hypothetical protein
MASPATTDEMPWCCGACACVYVRANTKKKKKTGQGNRFEATTGSSTTTKLQKQRLANAFVGGNARDRLRAKDRPPRFPLRTWLSPMRLLKVACIWLTVVAYCRSAARRCAVCHFALAHHDITAAHTHARTCTHTEHTHANTRRSTNTARQRTGVSSNVVARREVQIHSRARPRPASTCRSLHHASRPPQKDAPLLQSATAEG